MKYRVYSLQDITAKFILKFARWKNTFTKLDKCTTSFLRGQFEAKKNHFVLYTLTGDITFHPMFLRPQEYVSQHEIKPRSRVAHYTQDRLILKVKSVHHNRGEMMTGGEHTVCIEIFN